MSRKSLVFESLERIGRRRCIALAAIGICGILAIVVDRADIRPLAIGAARAEEAREVQIDNYSFSPGILTVRTGTIVTWVNHDETPHTIVSVGNPRVFKSGGLDTDDKFSFTFSTAGAYTYICSVHPHMIGKIIVQ
jgi:plastocyanin